MRKKRTDKENSKKQNAWLHYANNVAKTSGDFYPDVTFEAGWDAHANAMKKQRTRKLSASTREGK